MKKAMSLILAMVLSLSIITSVPLSASADYIKEWDLEFTLNEDCTGYIITRCYAFAYGDLIVPETHESLPVVGIRSYAFSGVNNVFSVTLTDSVKYIGDGAFSSCGNLEYVDFGEGIESIGEQAFVGCYNLISVDIPQSVTGIGSYAFSGCEGLSYVTMGDNVAEIGEGVFNDTAFFNSTSNWENGVLYADSNLIKANQTVNKVTVKDGTVTIADYAFSDSLRLSEVTLPLSLEHIGEGAFGNESTIEYTFYEGSKTQFKSVTKGKENNNLLLSKIHYNATGHTYSDEWTVDIEPTCIRDGEKSHHCTQCDERTDITSTGLGDHKLSSWIIDPDASVYGDGYKYIECTECGEVFETETIPQLVCATPKLSKVTNVASGVKFTWNKVEGADCYVVYRKSTGDWEKIAEEVMKTSYTDKTAENGITYRYTVKAENEAGLSESNPVGLAIKRLENPKLVSASNKSNGITIKWKKVTGADGYYVFRKTGSGSWKQIATIKGNTFTDKNAKAGKNYKYTVKAYYGSYLSAYDTDGLSIKRLLAPTLKSGVSTKSGISIKWGKVTGAKGYVVLRKTGSGAWKKIAMVKSNTKVTYIDKTARKGITYKYTVKAYYGKSESSYNTKGLTVKDRY